MAPRIQESATGAAPDDPEERPPSAHDSLLVFTVLAALFRPRKPDSKASSRTRLELWRKLGDDGVRKAA
jgi:hypothetical protein